MEKEDLILIVDDNINNLRVVGNILNENNYKIALSKDGESALKLLNKYTPSLILLDVMMPKMDGYEVNNEIQKIDRLKDVPVIFLTARNTSEDILEGFNNGGVDYITKPFNREELLVRIKTHIELFNARKTISQQANDLKKANDAKAKVFSIISHDMKTPLATLNMLLDKLINTDLAVKKDFANKALKLMQVSAFQTQHLLDNLLNWSRSQMGSIKCTPVYFDITKTIIAVIDLLQSTTEQKDIIIHFEQIKETICFADKNMIELVVRNLLTNAIKYSAIEGQVTISIEEKDNELTALIRDNGTGLSPSFLNSLFKSDLHESKLGTEGEKGTGLGLGICKSFIAMNKGKIGAYNNTEKGSCFYFSIPTKK